MKYNFVSLYTASIRELDIDLFLGNKGCVVCPVQLQLGSWCLQVIVVLVFSLIYFYYTSDGPDDITLTPRGSSHIVNKGGYLDNITCSAQCFPNCTYVWEKQGNQSSVITGNTLRLGNNIQSEVSGIYVCSVTNPERSEKPTNKEDVIIYVRCKYRFLLECCFCMEMFYELFI